MGFVRVFSDLNETLIKGNESSESCGDLDGGLGGLGGLGQGFVRLDTLDSVWGRAPPGVPGVGPHEPDSGPCPHSARPPPHFACPFVLSPPPRSLVDPGKLQPRFEAIEQTRI